MMADTTPQLRPFDGAAIPQALKDLPRWAPWAAKWNAKRGKFDKIPRRADVPEYGLSTANPDRWFTFAAAVAAFEREQPSLSGVGYVMTRPHGVVGVDLDDCVHNGEIAPWAREVVDALASYTEVSPSGKGLRIFALGEVADWTNHTVGVEVYGGAEPRFLTLTGQHLVGTPTDVRAAGPQVLDQLRAQYGREAAKAEGPVADMPEVLDDLVLPDLAGLDLPYAARDFLLEGECKGDRSRELHAAAVALYQCGLADDEVFSLLATSPHAMEVALDHRRQDTDRALLYLWREHTVKAKGKGGRLVASADDFDDVSEPAAEGAAPAPAKQKARRFQVVGTSEFLQRPRARWLVRHVLPRAGIAMVYGESGSGKTFFVLDLVAAISRGLPWRDHKVEQAQPVVYICAEGEDDFRDRVQAYCDFNGLPDLPIGIIPDSPNLLQQDHVRDLLAALAAFGPAGVVVVDTLAQTTAGADENSGQDMGRALAHCKAIQRKTGALVLLVHHSGKDSSRGPRGWSGIGAALDAVIEVERFRDDRQARIRKLKGGRDGAEFGFRLNTVEVGAFEDGEPITSCVVTHTAAPPKKQAEPKGRNQKLVLLAVEALLSMDDQVTPHQVWEYAAAQLVHDGKGRDTRRQVVSRAYETLIAEGQLMVEDGFVRLV